MHEAQNVLPARPGSKHASARHVNRGIEHSVQCDIVASCDGYHGASRASVQAASIQILERLYPFGYFGVLENIPPVSHESMYSNYSRGFALSHMRSHARSRCWVQCSREDQVENWSDDVVWDVQVRRLAPTLADLLITGPSIEKCIAPLRSFVAEPISFGGCSWPVIPRVS